MTDPSTGPDSDRWSAGSAWSADPTPTGTPSEAEPATHAAQEPWSTRSWATEPPTAPASPTAPAYPASPTAPATPVTATVPAFPITPIFQTSPTDTAFAGVGATAPATPPAPPPVGTPAPVDATTPAGAVPVGYAPGSAAVPPPSAGYPSGMPPTATLSAAPTPAYPVSSPAYPVSAPGHPVSGYPVSGYPVSGPGYPVSAPGYPVSGPVPGLAAAAPAKPRRTAVLVLSILMVVFLLAAGALGGLYVAKASAYQRQARTLSASNAKVDTQKNQLDSLQQQLKSTQDKLTDETQKATGVQNQVDELTHEKQVISQCLDLLGQADAAAAKGDRTTANKLLAQAQQPCDEANRYLN